MSSLLNVEGKEYTAATVAGKHFGYTKDYLLLLAKNGSIDGKKIGNKWYVHMPSVELFFKAAAEKKKVRREQVSNERKNELREHMLSHAGGHHRAAVLETLAILVIGLSLGTTGYIGVQAQHASVEGSDFSFLERIAVSFHGALTGESGQALTADAVDAASAAEVVGGEPEMSFVIAPEAMMSAESLDALRRSFSDPVEVTVDPLHPDTGLVVPEFKHRESEAYRFLMVPIHTE